MYTIDLLKRTRIPQRSKPVPVAFTTMTLVVPLAIGITVMGWYFEVTAEIPAQERLLAGHDERLRGLADVRAFLRDTAVRKQRLGGHIRELAAAVPTHAPWSERVRALAENVPPGLTISRLEVRRKSLVGKGAAGKKDPAARPAEKVATHEFTLQVGIYVPSDGKHTASIQDLKNRLARSSAFGCALQDINTIVWQGETIQGRPYTFYLLECVFKEE